MNKTIFFSLMVFVFQNIEASWCCTDELPPRRAKAFVTKPVSDVTKNPLRAHKSCFCCNNLETALIQTHISSMPDLVLPPSINDYVTIVQRYLLSKVRR